MRYIYIQIKLCTPKNLIINKIKVEINWQVFTTTTTCRRSKIDKGSRENNQIH